MALKQHRRFLKLLPLACMYARYRREMDWWTCSKIPDVSWIEAAAAIDIHAFRSISDLTVVSSVVVLKDLSFPPGSDASERTFDDSAATSLDIFPHAIEQRHIHYRRQGRS
ncbi:hypothetical protein TNCV_3303281 [Trichonephila clavipes]|nr:hypothetical protein TNCV_3303281 [Trichonephila clavipes]